MGKTQLNSFDSTKINSFLRFFLVVILIIGCTWIIALFLPDAELINGSVNIGLFSLIPAFFLILYIFITKRILEALILASLMCFVFSDGVNFFSEFTCGLSLVLQKEDTVWLIIVCGLMGSIIKLIEKTA